MAGIFEVEDLQAKKRALVRESEVYRQTLVMEFHNLRLYTERIRSKVTKLSRLNPFLTLAAPLAGGFFRRTVGRSKLRFVGKALMAWRLYKQFAPLLRGVVDRFQGRTRQAERFTTEEV